jgi:hypothetical protein
MQCRCRQNESAAFTNYIDETVSLGPDAPKTAEMWLGASERFRSILAELQPCNVIVLGKVMWRETPECDIHVLDDLQAYRIPEMGDLAWCWAVMNGRAPFKASAGIPRAR